MDLNDRKFNRLKSFLFIGAVLIVFSMVSGTAAPGSNWLDKGLNIFKTYTQEKKIGEPTIAEIGEAFKEALSIGTENVVQKLGRSDGFNADPSIHIPLPQELNNVKTMLSKVGMSESLDDLELKLNRAAEAATPKAKQLFFQAITDMTFDDVKSIYNGPEDAATKYFQGKMSPSLAKEMRPIVEESLSKVGAIQSYDRVMGSYRSLPFVPDVKADLTNHVIGKGMDGIFYYVAKEEAAIRQNPAKRTTDLLKRVFGAK